MQFLSNLGAVLKSIVVAIGKLLYLLLLKLYLIIPALYVLAIWIASLCVPFRMGNYATLVIVGTVLCAALSFLLVLRRWMLGAKKSTRKEPSNVTATTVPTPIAAPAPTEPAAQTAEPAAEMRPAPEHAPAADPYADPPAPSAPPEPREDAPRYYRSRKDPALCIAEYPDRYEYYRRLPNGQYAYFMTEPKR